MSTNKLNKIIDFFKTKHMINVTLANENFYKGLEKENISADTLDMIVTYINSGFKIKKSHSSIIKKKKKYTGNYSRNNEKLIEDPFFYVWNMIAENTYKIINEKNEDRDYEYRKISDILEFIWENGVDENYKKIIRKNNLVIHNFTNYSGEGFYKIKYNFVNIRGFKFYMDEIGINNMNKKDILLFKEALIKSAETLAPYKVTYQEEKEYINYLIESLKNKYKNDVLEINEETKLNEEILKSLYSKNNNVKNSKKITKKDVEENKETLNMIKTLKLLTKNFTEQDIDTKLIYEKILEDVKNIVNSEKYIKDIQLKVEINNLLHKHLPETVSNYFDLPEKYRFDFKDNNNNTPQNILIDTFNEIQNKIKYHLDIIYNENFTNLKVKNRFMKAF